MTTQLPAIYGELAQARLKPVPVLASQFESGAFLADGEAKARSEVIGAFRVRVLSRLLRRGIPPGDADSVTLEVFRKALHPSEAPVAEEDFPAVLHRIAERVCMDYYRRRRRTAQFGPMPSPGVRAGAISRTDFEVSAFIARNSRESRAS